MFETFCVSAVYDVYVDFNSVIAPGFWCAVHDWFMIGSGVFAARRDWSLAYVAAWEGGDWRACLVHWFLAYVAARRMLPCGGAGVHEWFMTGSGVCCRVRFWSGLV